MIKLAFTVENNLEIEATRIVQTYWQILNGFYLKNRFIVLPKLVPNTQTIFLPRIEYLKDKNLKAYLNAEFRYDYVLQEFLKPIEKEITDLKLISEYDYIQRIKDILKWIETNHKNLESTFSNIFNLDVEYNIEIKLVTFGSWVSFSNSEKGHLIITLRKDMPLDYLVEGIVTSISETLLYPENQFTAWQQDWEKNEYLVDFLLKHSQISKLIPNFQETLKSLKSYELGEYALESKKYLEDFGFSLQSRLSKLEDKILVDNKVLNDLTKSQFDILNLLIDKRNQLVTFDEIGKLIWQKDFVEKYSPWAIAKHIQGLREKLRFAGLNSNIIQTFRKQGIVLFD